jgi:hypothetical protein
VASGTSGRSSTNCNKPPKAVTAVAQPPEHRRGVSQPY